MSPTIPYPENIPVHAILGGHSAYNVSAIEDVARLACGVCGGTGAAAILTNGNDRPLEVWVGTEPARPHLLHQLALHLSGLQQAIEIEDLAGDSKWQWMTEAGIRAFAATRLAVMQNVQLILWVGDATRRPFTDLHRQTLATLGVQLAHSLHLQISQQHMSREVTAAARQRADLQQLMKSQSRFISYIAHDVRNPITSLKSIIELNKLKALTLDEVNELFSMLNKQVDGTLEMLTNLIEWGHAQLERKTPHTRSVNLHKVVLRKYALLEVAAHLKNNRLVNLVAPGTCVMGDEYMIRFILRNLLVNANKFTSGGVVAVEATEGDGFVTISVSDTGTGFSEEVRQMLFDPERRITHPGTSNERGSGIGLKLVNEFVQKLDTQLHISSEVGKGSCFSFKLPTAPAQ